MTSSARLDLRSREDPLPGPGCLEPAMNTQLDPAQADWISILPGVSDALARGKPVVALESTVITHGLPRPLNLEIARRLEGEIQSAGAVPATIAIVQGEVRVGLDDVSMEALRP